MVERSSEWYGHRLTVLPPGDSWLKRAENSETSAPLEPPPLPPEPAAAATSSWLSAVVLAVLGIAALITIVVAGGSRRTADPAPLPQVPGEIITALTTAQIRPVHIHVGDYLQLQLPTGRIYSTVVEQSSTTTFVVEDLKLPGQQPRLRADNPGHATVQVMSEPVCATSDAVGPTDSCPDQRLLLGTLDVTVTQ